VRLFSSFHIHSPSFTKTVSRSPSALPQDDLLSVNGPVEKKQESVRHRSLLFRFIDRICLLVASRVKANRGCCCGILVILLQNQVHAGDPKSELLDFLEKASRSIEILSGTIEEIKLSDTDITKGSLPLKSDAIASVARFFKNGENILLETSGNIELSNVGPGSRFNNIADVIVFSDDQVFEFLPLGSGADPFGNLHIYRPKDVPQLRRRIDENLIFVLSSAYQVNGLSVAPSVISPEVQVSGDLQSGLSLHAKSGSKEAISNSRYNVTASDGKFSTYAQVEGQITGAGSLVIEVRCDGLWDGLTAIPNVVVRKVSGAAFGDPVVNQYKVIYEPWDESVKFPVDKLFFKRYERDYTVSDGLEFKGEVIEAVPEHIRGLGMKRFSASENPLRRGYGYTIAAGVLLSLLVILGTFWILKKGRVR
jgi:hypothetical protein